MAGVEKEDNELNVMETMHHFVEVLDRYFGNVCELDIIFNFHIAYFLLDEIIIGGNIQETSNTHTLSSSLGKKQVLKMVSQQDQMMDEAFFKEEAKNATK